MYSYVLLSLFLLANLQGSDCDKKELKPPFNVANTLALGLQTNTKNFSVTFYTELGERPLRMQFSFTDPIRLLGPF
ncbi:unnamed protein product [Bursaphelenchus okinawaensis]|uniref:Uncharacterized protein n=1 Tax=Bursaphelenchus okinawaensis TaxID=465554 RepID=A0A811JPV5_9BILA|nr:unnamed protein product [Bursaphelenchus okinawaensis]CAG9077151.1 unnamed protein product [Bursaphelenchus okinawaensis]